MIFVFCILRGDYDKELFLNNEDQKTGIKEVLISGRRLTFLSSTCSELA